MCACVCVHMYTSLCVCVCVRVYVCVCVYVCARMYMDACILCVSVFNTTDVCSQHFLSGYLWAMAISRLMLTKVTRLDSVCQAQDAA